TNSGIFCINELPDLAERIQLGLLNIMEERHIQIRGYKIRLPLDVYVVASANPEDYTNRGRIITPLKDRVGSEIRTHYPRTVEHEIQIMESESNHFITEGLEIIFPQFMKEIIAEITQLARRSNDISQRSGVSVRVGDDMPCMEYVNQLSKVGGLSKAIDKLNGRGSPASIASSIEFILEGLHLNRRLNKDEVRGKIRYRR